jgi:hypothetical protein
MRSILSVALGCCLVFAENIAAPAQSPPGNLSPTQFDLVCAMVSGAEMGASQNAKDAPRRNMYTTLFSYYLGRLGGRDDTKDWNGIVRGCGSRVAASGTFSRNAGTLFELLHVENRVSGALRTCPIAPAA